jgi:hypothetical protein
MTLDVLNSEDDKNEYGESHVHLEIFPLFQFSNLITV